MVLREVCRLADKSGLPDSCESDHTNYGPAAPLIDWSTRRSIVSTSTRRPTRADCGIPADSRAATATSPKLRCGGWVDSWLNWGFVGLVGRRFWLRGGQGDWGADEVEGAALVGGGFG